MRHAAVIVWGVFLPLLVHADSSRTRQASISRFLVSVPGEGVVIFDLKGTPLW